MTRHELRQSMLVELTKTYAPREAENLVNYYFDAHLETDLDRLQVESDSLKLLQGQPVQYVTNTSFFYGYQFCIDTGVLIPRPETEELVHWIVSDYKNREGLRFLDIGCGSGCILLTILQKLSDITSYGLDISPVALELTRKNADQFGLDTTLILADITKTDGAALPTNLDFIVSNPPYISRSELSRMGASVLEHEPEQALFVDDDDPLLFYKHIITIGKALLQPAGVIYFETSDTYHIEMKRHLELLDLQFEYRTDMQGKLRMLKVQV